MPQKTVKRLKLLYGNSLTNQQAMIELGLSHGRELGAILYTDKLPSLSVEDIAKFIDKKNKKLSLKERLLLKYHNEILNIEDFAFELGLSKREAEALLKIYMLPYGTVSFVVNWLKNYEINYQKFTKRRYLELMYWHLKLSAKEIANILGTTPNVIQRLININNLVKRKNGIKPKGKIGFKMSQEQKIKRKNQPHAKPVVQICPKTFKVVAEYSSIGSVKECGFSRENVRRSIKIAGLHKGFLWSYAGQEESVIARAKDGVEKRMKMLSFERPTKKELKQLYNDRKMTLEECAKHFGCHTGTIASLVKEYGLKKFTTKIDIDELKQLYLKEGFRVKDIAQRYGYTVSTVRTYLSKNNIKRRAS